MICSWVVTSSPVVGSSSTTRSGSQAHQHLVEPAADIAAKQAQEGANHEPYQGGGQRQQHHQVGTVHDAAEDIAPELVHPERMGLDIPDNGTPVRVSDGP